ncbi:MAG TPA: hypothetical protein DCP28_26805, partial [Cytophagales bacterium]|nr:hypothetical protein [Cytophagales bacterium]
ADPELFRHYNDIVKEPLNALDIAKEGGRPLLDKVARSAFFRDVTEAGRKFKESMLDAVLDNTSPTYQRLKGVIPDLDERRVVDQVQFCLPGFSHPCNESGEYFIADMALLKYDQNGDLIDMIIIETKMNQGTTLTTGQTIAKNNSDSRFALRSPNQLVDSDNIALPNEGLLQGNDIKSSLFVKIYGDGNGNFLDIE